MSNFTFLTYEQIYLTDQLEILKKYRIKSEITDFSIMLGGRVDLDCYTWVGNTRKNRIGWWWTKSGFFYAISSVYYGSEVGNINDRDIGARPAIPYSGISSMCSEPVRDEYGILEVEYGEYPQMVVDEGYSVELERAYNNGSLRTTEKTYTTDSANRFSNVKFKPRKHTEYEYEGKKYIRFVGDLNCVEKILSDGRKIQLGQAYWVSVEPITWLVDEKTGIALSKKIIFSGVQFKSGTDHYDGDFDKTDIKQFMDTYFSKDIVPVRTSQKEEDQSSERFNQFGFSFERVTEEDIIRGAIESGVAVFLHGASSEGKSSRIKQIDPDCVILYLRNATPESLNGKSVYNSETGEMIDIKPTWLKKLEERCEKETDKLHILFLDEITNALPSIQGMAFNIVLDREVNGMWELPKNARIVAAGNDMKDSLAANQLAEPLFNRFVHVYIKTKVDSWLKWASENKIHPSIYAYIAYKGSKSLRTPYNGEKPNADPRKWEMASKMLYATGQPEMLRSLIGENITKEFCQFCKQRVITLEDVIEGNYTERDLEMDTAEKYATIVGLSGAKEEEYEQVREFVKKLGPEFCAIYDTMWSRGEETRMEMVAEVRTINSKGGI